MCNNNRYKHTPHMSGVEFFPIPKPKTRLEDTLQWVKACGRKDYTVGDVNKHAYVCSKHFVDGRPTTLHPYPIMTTPSKQTVHKSRKLPFDRAIHTKASITTPTNSKIVDHVWRNVGAYLTLNGTNTSKDQPLQATAHFFEELKVDADHTYYAEKRGFNVQTTSISTQTDITMEEMDSLTDNMMDTSSIKRKNLMNDIMKDNKFCKFYTVEYGDDIMADRGFLIRGDLALKGATLNIPSFSMGKHMCSNATTETDRIARGRIHVGRAIGRLKNFTLLQRTIPLRMKHTFNQVVKVCAILCNLDSQSVK
ncbi:unnamed protein product [Mytilus edulis]|uniref:THAP-type domain-containing protein n=1 Tax=Mytilus edulis TaxID=6550 RepID=A0A8S3TUZ7_MYTED|nr:unnamed protein product [Mytilus edulis]